jgi:uncharacterized protein
MQSTKKIVNDPVYGFINIPSGLIYHLIEHPYFQRLRRIKQLGLTHLIYPGANHSRFQHVMGAMHLMASALDIIREKGQDITDDEAQGVMVAILLHDIGHGPFSHTLEKVFIPDLSHEDLSLMFMQYLNQLHNGALNTAIRIFKNEYPKKFLHQLVSSQLDMDRLDYLQRDSFFTGVSEGVIGSERIIKMLNVVNDELVVDAKGIYSIENFLIARRLMYWQVYFHKTVLSAEQMLVKILGRAKMLARDKQELWATPALHYFLYNEVRKKDFHDATTGELNFELLERFSHLDDDDIQTCVKAWMFHPDYVLSYLCRCLVNRNLFALQIQDKPFKPDLIRQIRRNASLSHNFSEDDLDYIVFDDFISNNAYSIKSDNINILYKTGRISDIAQASDMSNVSALSKTVKKFFLCYPKDCRIPAI